MENRKYFKALDSLEVFLKKYPTNGEANTLKGMCLATLASFGDDAAREQGIALMKQGLSFNLKSPRSWHVQGLYYKASKQWDEALKSYQQVHKAMRQENIPISAQLLQDMTGLQAQLGKWDDYLETRRQILQMPNINLNVHWPGYAVGAHLCGRHDVSVAALDSYQLQLNSPYSAPIPQAGSIPKVELGEICLYRVEVLYQKGDFTAALANLEEHKPSIVDVYAYNMYKIRILLHLERFEEARAIILEEVLAENIDHLEAVLLFFKSHQISLNNIDKTDVTLYTTIKTKFDELLGLFPKSATITRLSLQFYQGDDLKQPLVSYLKPNLAKGVPSLFKTVKSFYANNDFIVTYIEELLLSFIDSLKANNTFPGEDKQQTPTTLLSTYVYLAQHYDFFGLAEKAFEQLTFAEQHTPTFIDLYVYRAKVYKHSGNHQAAYYWVDYARSLDTADRWLNNKCAMYAYQAGHDDNGDRTVQLFIKDKSGVHPYQYREQASWWYYQSGCCYARAKNYPFAIKNLSSIANFFEQYQEGVYDYHQYCVRRAVLRAYTGMMTYLTAIRTHKFYVRFALKYVQLLLALHHQAQFELTANNINNNDQAGEFTGEPTTLAQQQQQVRDVMGERDLYKWRKDYLLRIQSEKKVKNDVNEEVDGETQGSSTQHPHYDIFGENNYLNTFLKPALPKFYHNTNTKITTGNVNTFLQEAYRILSAVIHAYGKDSELHNKMSRITEEAQNNASAPHQIPPAVLMLAVHVNVLMNKPLNALKYYNMLEKKVLPEYFAKLSTINTKTQDQVLKQHFNGGLDWFNLTHSTSYYKAKHLPTFYKAEMLKLKLLLTHTYQQDDAHAFAKNTAVQAAGASEDVITAYKKQISNAPIFDVKLSLEEHVTTLLTQQQQAITTDGPITALITLCGVLQAAYYTATKVDFVVVEKIVAEVVAKAAEQQLNLRLPLAALLSVLQQFSGECYQTPDTKTIPTVLGLPTPLTAPEQCTFAVYTAEKATIAQAITTLVSTAAKLYPNDAVFMNDSTIAENNTKYTVKGPDFLTPPEKDLW